MLNRIWHLIGVWALAAGGGLGISRGPDGDVYSVLAFLVVVIGVAALMRAQPETCAMRPGLALRLIKRRAQASASWLRAFARARRAGTTAGQAPPFPGRSRGLYL